MIIALIAALWISIGLLALTVLFLAIRVQRLEDTRVDHTVFNSWIDELRPKPKRAKRSKGAGR